MSLVDCVNYFYSVSALQFNSNNNSVKSDTPIEFRQQKRMEGKRSVKMRYQSHLYCFF